MSKSEFEMFDTSDTIDNYNTSDINITTEGDNKSSNYVNLTKINFIKIGQIIIGVLIFNLIFAIVSYTMLYNEFLNANHFVDFYYFGLVTLTSTGYGDILPSTHKAKVFISIYLLLVYSFMLSFTL